MQERRKDHKIKRSKQCNFTFTFNVYTITLPNMYSFMYKSSYVLCIRHYV